MLPIITNSRIKAFRTCPRYHHYLYDLGYDVVKKGPRLSFGVLVHVLLEAWWQAPQGERMDAVLAAIPPDTDEYDVVRAFEMMRGYDARWGQEKWNVLSVEKEFNIPRKDWILAGKIDVLVGDSEGRVFIVEHKTSSEDISPGSAYWQRLRLDSQITIYWLAAIAMGLNPHGCIYDVLAKPALRPLGANSKRDRPETSLGFAERIRNEIISSPDKYYARAEIVRLGKELEDGANDFAGWVDSLLPGFFSNRRNPDACVRFGRVCEFLPVCSGESGLDNQGLYRKKDSIHEELTMESVLP